MKLVKSLFVLCVNFRTEPKRKLGETYTTKIVEIAKDSVVGKIETIYGAS